MVCLLAVDKEKDGWVGRLMHKTDRQISQANLSDKKQGYVRIMVICRGTHIS